MILTFNKLTKFFEDSILSYLKLNNKSEEFDKVRENILVASTKEEFGDFQSNVSLISVSYTHLTLPTTSSV